MPFNFEPLRVRLFLSSPWATPCKKAVYPLHFDALIVALLAARRGLYHRPFAADGYDPAADPFAPGCCPDVPLKVAGRGGVKIYQASAALPGSGITLEPAAWRASWVKRAPGPMVASRRKGKDGWRKPVMGSYLCLSVFEVQFFCVGDQSAIADLLCDLRGLGVGRQAGYGQVSHAVVERTPAGADPETWGILYGGKPVRFVPLGFWPEGAGLGWRKACAAARPPYWHPALREICWAPGVPTLPDFAMAAAG